MADLPLAVDLSVVQRPEQSQLIFLCAAPAGKQVIGAVDLFGGEHQPADRPFGLIHRAPSFFK